MPEGDTIRYAANRMRPLLEQAVPDEIATPQRRHRHDRWPERLAHKRITAIDTHGKHLFIRFDGGLAIHSHLGMSGSWDVFATGQRWRRAPSRAWLVIRVPGHEIVEFDGPQLELMTDGRTRFDQRLQALGPDVLAARFDSERFIANLRQDDQTRTVGDALLDQRTIAGIGNIWKAEGCWEAAVDPWRRLSELSDAEAVQIIESIRPRMLRSAAGGPTVIEPRVYKRAGRPCPRCGGRIEARGQGDANRTTYWCGGCQA
jgi:endonuclease-8